MKRFDVVENGIHMVWEVDGNHRLKLLHFSALPFDEGLIRVENKSGFRPVEIALAGVDRPEERHGGKYTVTGPGWRMEYVDHSDTRSEAGRRLAFRTADPVTGVEVVSHYQFYDGIRAVRCWSVVENRGREEQCLEYISSFNLNGIEKEGVLDWDDKVRVHIPHNSWQRELQWREYSLDDLGMAQCQPEGARRSSKTISATNCGAWSAKEYLPMGYVENRETGAGLIWQIEHSGSWHWEISDQNDHLYLQISGPTEKEGHWFQMLQPGESFQSVPVCVGASLGGFEDGVAQLTRYRRAVRRKNRDNESLGIIFNDYMNCLMAEPTTEKELPLIDAAAQAGCEYYCIDAGWYADGYWWDEVGEWLPSEKRFPGGIKEVLDYIRAKGMIPGLWLEIEVMGVHCPKVAEVPADWFFQRHGKPVFDRSRYQLDFRAPAVAAYADGVIRRLVEDYGVGYIKMDYNIEPGTGTEVDADSPGAGLLGHQRAYLDWLDRIFARYPDLIIENCSSGGLRMDYALLARHSIQSTSDQEDYRMYATIAANSPAGLTPEQSAVWSYPLAEADRDQVVFNMVNALLLRVHQSGHLAELSGEGRALVKEALTCYKSIRRHIREGLPFWPLGLSHFGDDWVSLGLRDGDVSLLALWRREGGGETCVLPVPHLKGREVEATCLYPGYRDCDWAWNRASGTLSVRLPRRTSARLFRLVLQ